MLYTDIVSILVALALKSESETTGFCRTDITLSKMKELLKPNVHIRSRERIENIIQKIVDGGKDKLQIIADFDMTLSRYSLNGRRCDTCHNALDESKLLPEFYRTEAKRLRDTYYPIEVEPSLTEKEKFPKMEEWWTKAHNLLEQCNLNKNVIKHVVSDSKVMLRDGCNWTFTQLHQHDVPLLIFSAGIGDVIEEVIRQQSSFYDNMKIVSNYMDFDAQGHMVGFKGDLIHVFNKNEAAVHKSDYFERLRGRDNVILLGDSTGDLRMAEGVEAGSTLLKIGFLNDKVEQRMEEYLDKYDIVLTSDESMDVPNAILRKTLHPCDDA